MKIVEIEVVSTSLINSFGWFYSSFEAQPVSVHVTIYMWLNGKSIFWVIRVL
jgi:hypothetical protein